MDLALSDFPEVVVLPVGGDGDLHALGPDQPVAPVVSPELYFGSINRSRALFSQAARARRSTEVMSGSTTLPFSVTFSRCPPSLP